MDLKVWSPDFGLPSIDQQCLAFISYSRFSGAPVNVLAHDNPFWTREGNLPEFRHMGKTISSFSTFVKHLEDCKFSADFNLSGKQKSECAAFTNMMEESLKPALALLFWIDAKNHIEFTRPWFAKRLNFPLGFVYPSKYFKKAKEIVQSSTSIDCGSTHQADVDYVLMEKAVTSKAIECFKCLSDRLGDNLFMFGSTPSSFDALVFSYLAPIMKVKFPSSSQMQQELQQHQNLSQFVSRIVSQYFPGLPSSSDVTNESKASAENEDNVEGSVVTMNNFLATLAAMAAMTGYAFYSGLVTMIVDNKRRRIN